MITVMMSVCAHDMRFQLSKTVRWIDNHQQVEVSAISRFTQQNSHLSSRHSFFVPPFHQCLRDFNLFASQIRSSFIMIRNDVIEIL